MDSSNVTATNFLLSKIWYVFGALIGSSSLAVFWQPEQLKKHSRRTSGIIIGSVGTGLSFATGGFVAMHLGLDPMAADVGMTIGAAVGLVALALVSYFAKLFDRQDGMDIIEVVGEVRKAMGAKPKRKAPAKKTAKATPKKVVKKTLTKTKAKNA